jgi:hypothetical protein
MHFYTLFRSSGMVTNPRFTIKAVYKESKRVYNTTMTNDAEPRYKVIKESQSAHCCFEATVVDTHKLEMTLKDRDGLEYPLYSQVCECFEIMDAHKICDALNLQEDLTRRLTE